jgi:hypothetical protein
MDFNHLQSLSPADRKELLEADAAHIVTDALYTRPLSEEEVAYYKSELTENSILQSELLEQKKELIAEFKKKLEPVQKKISDSLKAVKFKAIDEVGTLYQLADFDEHRIHTVNQDGLLINSRSMLPHERQLRIQVLKQESKAS